MKASFRRFQVLSWLVLVSMAARGASQPLPDAAAPVDIDVQVGFDGYYHPGTWVPVTVRAASAKTAYKGELSFEVPRAETRRDVYRLPIDLEKNATKRYSLLAFLPDWHYELTCRITDRERGFPVTMKPVTEAIVLTIGEEEGPPLIPLEAASSAGEGNFYLRPTRPDEFPRSHLGLQSIDLLVVRGSLVPPLDEEQARAVVDWLQAGGTLLVHPDNFGRVAKELQDLLPVEVTGSRQTSRDPFRPRPTAAASPPGEYLVPSFSLLPEADVLIGTDEQPILIAHPVEYGNVMFVPFDLSNTRFRKHPESANLWGPVMGQLIPLQHMTWDGYYQRRTVPFFGETYSTNYLDAVLKQGSGPTFGHLLAIFVFLLVYLIAIGPALSSFLGKRRREKSAILIPVLALAFASAGFAGTKFFRSSRVEIRQYEFVRKIPGEARAVSNSICSLFSSSKGRFSLVGEDAPLLFLPSPTVDEFGDLPTAVFNQVSRPGGQELSFNMHPWTAKTFMAEQFVPIEGDLIADLRVRGATVSGTLVSQLDFDLKFLYLVYGEEIFPLGNLDSGASRTVEGKRSLGDPLAEQAAWTQAPEKHLRRLMGSRIVDATVSQEAEKHYIPYVSGVGAMENRLSSWRPTFFLIGLSHHAFIRPVVRQRVTSLDSTALLIWPLANVPGDRLVLGCSEFQFHRGWNPHQARFSTNNMGTGEIRIVIPNADRVGSLELLALEKGAIKVNNLSRGEWETIPAAERRELPPPEEILYFPSGALHLMLEEFPFHDIYTTRLRVSYDQD